MTPTLCLIALRAALLAGALASMLAGPASLGAQVILEKNAPPKQVVQELFLSELVQAQERGEVQLTVKGRAHRVSSDAWLRRGQGLIEVGLTDRVQLSLVTPDLGTDLDPASRRWEPGLLVALVPQAMPMAISAIGSVTFGRGAAPTTDLGFVVARTWYALQLHAANSWNVTDGRQTSTFAGLYDRGRFTPTLELVIDSDEAERAWVVVPGAYVHAGRSLELGAGAVLSPARGAVLAGGRVVLTASF
jgi:hypothetical protein